MGFYKRVRERLVFQNRWIELYDDDISRPDDTPGTYARLRYRGDPPGVVIVPRLPDGRFLLLRAFRYAFGAVSLEFPRGMADVGEAVEAAARRELLEETGLIAERCEEMGVHCPDTSIVETRVHILLAEVPSLATLRLDTEVEGIAGHEVLTAYELRSAVSGGEIHDGFSLGAYGLLAALGKVS